MLFRIISKIKTINMAAGIMFMLILLNTAAYGDKPIVGVTGVKAGSLRVTNISALLESQLINVINGTGIFNILNPELLKDQLSRYGCVEEECILAFARTAGINMLIRAYVEDKGDSIILNIYSQGINAPYYGKIIYKYRAEIPVADLSLSTHEYTYITEEHAAYFLSGFLRKYKAQLFVKINKNESLIDLGESVSGIFDLYRYEDVPPSGENIRLFKSIGKVKVDKKSVKIISPEGISLKDNDFIFVIFTKKADFIDDLFYGRKHELVFNEGSLTDTTVLFFSTIPASALMPVIAPLGYYRTGDFAGLSLWAINSFPYLYIEYTGLKNRIKTYINDRDISRKNITYYRFGLYMLLCGSMPLVVDAFSGNMLDHAAGYQGIQPYMGNTATAVYLSLISGGGGLFYRGYRFEGYLYFHLHNILLYLSLWEFSSSGQNNHSKSSEKHKAYTYLGALGALKLIEITHVILAKDNIRNGKLLEESYGFEPALYRDDLGLNYGMQYTVRY